MRSIVRKETIRCSAESWVPSVMRRGTVRKERWKKCVPLVLQTTHHLLAFSSFPAQLCTLYQVETSGEDV